MPPAPPPIQTFTPLTPRSNTRLYFTTLVGLIAFLIIGYITLYGSIGNRAPDSATLSLLIPPAEADQATYNETVARESVAGDTITLSEGCVMDPLVLRLRADAVLKIDNRDSVTHTLAFEDNDFFGVPASKIREISLAETFKKGAGTYRYRCSDLTSDKNVGVLYIIE